MDNREEVAVACVCRVKFQGRNRCAVVDWLVDWVMVFRLLKPSATALKYLSTVHCTSGFYLYIHKPASASFAHLS
jgi:hypothetical protein